MTLTPADIYWVTRLDAVCAIMFIVSLLSLFGTIGLIIATDWDDYNNEDAWQHKTAVRQVKWLKISSITLAVTLLLAVFTPSTREAAMMYAVPKIVNSETVKIDVPEIYNLGVEALKDWLKNKGGNQ